jgi:ATP-dependent DNA helicase RecG
MPALSLDTPVTYLKGVGPARAALLEAKGLHTAEDLLFYPPFRYEDRSHVRPISQLQVGETATVIVNVFRAGLRRLPRQRMDLFEVTFRDDAGQEMRGKWFRGAWLSNVLVPGLRVALYGRVEKDSYGGGGLSMVQPEHEVLSEDQEDAALHTGRIVPVYEAVGKLSTRVLRSILWRLVENMPELPEALPQPLIQRYKLLSPAESMRQIHFPPADAQVPAWNASRSPAHWRLIFEEFFWLECGLSLKRERARRATGIAFALTDKVRAQLLKMLPFKPTGAQKRVLQEIARDMASPSPMSRMLQGDVGSGKTLVAAEAAVIAVENGCQAVILAPTEILAQQHFFSLSKLFGRIGYLTGILTGSMSATEKAKTRRLIAAGLLPVVIGTHALLQEDVEFHRLGLVIIDEQHRFGVLQRMSLARKGESPDVLVMTATPIPRTLALTIYGDLDTSTIDELPPGRTAIETKHFAAADCDRVWRFVRQQVSEGRQAYVVCPAIEENESTGVKAAQKTHEHLSQRIFPDLTIGLLHGKLPTDRKETVMKQFQAGEIPVLVATTVVEVGVDVPNATIMVIEQADRFGLAQLHQLRGRVGRGAHRSYCFLLTDKTSDSGEERIRTMVETTDGFRIAETDLKLRGPGEFFGTKQSGVPVFRFGNLIRDRDILEVARGEAQSFIANPPSEEELQRVVVWIRDHWQRRYSLVQVG